MQNKINLSKVLYITFILFLLSTPVIAQDLPLALLDMDKRFEHTIMYDIGGEISIDRQLGHDKVTGAVKYQRVRGYGEMTKLENVRMAANIIAIKETSDWLVPSNALGNLRITTQINLASRPMATAAEDYEEDGYSIEENDVINIYDPAVVSSKLEINRLTEQIWATAIYTNPGNNGSYHSDFIAAYGPGPYEREYGVLTEAGELFFYDEDYLWTYEEGIPWFLRDDRRKGYERGDYYVGNYFNIEQYAHTSGGGVRRFISISNPFDLSLLEEDMAVVGSASIRETFDTHGLMGGPKAITFAWYELF